MRIGRRVLGYSLILVLILGLVVAFAPGNTQSFQNDVSRSPQLIVIGGDAGGIGAAIAAARAGTPVVLISEDEWLGGMLTAGGIGVMDGNPMQDADGRPLNSLGLVGGLLGEFRAGLVKEYPHMNGDLAKSYAYEPSRGAAVVDRMADHPNLRVIRKATVSRVNVSGSRITSVEVQSPLGNQTLSAPLFVDGTDTGVLVGLVGLPSRTGRDDNPALVQAYAVRATWMRGAGMVVPFESDEYGREIPPPDYQLNRPYYAGGVKHVRKRLAEGVAGSAQAHLVQLLSPYGRIPGTNKWVMNGDWNDITIDHIAAILSKDPDIAYLVTQNGRPNPLRANITLVSEDSSLPPAERRRLLDKIDQAVRNRALGLLYYVRNESGEPGASEWGLSPEYGTTDALPPKVYVREGRRIIGRDTVTEVSLCPSFLTDKVRQVPCSTRPPHVPSVIALGDYGIDIHRVNLKDPGFYMPLQWPHQIPYGAIRPQQLSNLLVTSAISATHFAYGSLRMDPLRLLTGQAAGVAAHLASASGTDFDGVQVDMIQRKLVESGVMLSYTADIPFDPLSGQWDRWGLFIPTQLLALKGALHLDEGYRVEPDRPMTQGEYLWYLARLGQWSVDTGRSMSSQVREGSPFAREIITAIDLGMLKAGEIAPERSITAKEAKLLFKRTFNGKAELSLPDGPTALTRREVLVALAEAAFGELPATPGDGRDNR